MSLENVLGKTEVCKQLSGLIASERLPHAIVFESPNSELAEKAAKEIAKACVCSGKGIRPCGICPDCVKAEKDIHPDIYKVKITDKKQAVGVGEIRSMIGECYIKPNEAGCKVFLIFDKMTIEAQNALLKILEEPPRGVFFILTAESSAALLQTILSRSTVFKLGTDALSRSGKNDHEVEEAAAAIAKAIPKNIELPLLIAMGKLTDGKEFARNVLGRLAEILSMALEDKYFRDDNIPEYISELSRTLKKRSIVKLIDVISEAQEMITHNCNMNLLATWLCANIRQSRHES